MCKANSFLLGVLPDIKIMVAERERVRGLVQQPAHPKVSLSRPTATGGDEELTRKTIPQKGIILMLLYTVRDDRLAM